MNIKHTFGSIAVKLPPVIPRQCPSVAARYLTSQSCFDRSNLQPVSNLLSTPKLLSVGGGGRISWVRYKSVRTLAVQYF